MRMRDLIVRIDRGTLLERIKENRRKHRDAFLQALDGYHEMLIADLETKISSIRRGKTPDLIVRLPVPDDHTSEYDAVIQMLEMAADDTIEMSTHDFRAYVLDEWDWKDRWSATMRTYTTSV